MRATCLRPRSTRDVTGCTQEGLRPAASQGRGQLAGEGASGRYWTVAVQRPHEGAGRAGLRQQRVVGGLPVGTDKGGSEAHVAGVVLAVPGRGAERDGRGACTSAATSPPTSACGRQAAGLLCPASGARISGSTLKLTVWFSLSDCC